MNHDVPDRPWAKIATDLLSLDFKTYLVTVDYFSNFFEIDRLYDTKTRPVIKKLKAHIARYLTRSSPTTGPNMCPLSFNVSRLTTDSNTPAQVHTTTKLTERLRQQ